MFRKNNNLSDRVNKEVIRYKLNFHLVNGEVVTGESDWIAPHKLIDGISSFIKFLFMEKTILIEDEFYNVSNIIKIVPEIYLKSKVKDDIINLNPDEWEYRYSFEDWEVEVDKIESL